MIYTLTVTQNGTDIFAHDILVEPGFSFGEQVTDALRVFRLNYPGILLSDPGVSMLIAKKP